MYERYVRRPNRSTACIRFGRYRFICLGVFPITPHYLNAAESGEHRNL